MANIYDVAKTARVSVATVSAVVNGSAYVSPALKARVEQAVAKLGYQPNLVARSLATQQSRTLGMIVPDIANPFFPEVVRGAEDTAYDAGYMLLIASSDNDTNKGRGLPSTVRRQTRRRRHLHQGTRPDARIVADNAGAPACRWCCSRAPFPDSAWTSSKSTTSAPTHEGVTHLLRLGYRRVGFIAGLGGARTTRRRLDGYRAALATGNRRSIPALVVNGDFRVESGYRAGLELLKRRPDAVFISNYLMSVGFMSALRQYQLRCPEDVAIVTCDDHPWLDSFSPRLTTIDLPKRELGAAARPSAHRAAGQAVTPRHADDSAAQRDARP